MIKKVVLLLSFCGFGVAEAGTPLLWTQSSDLNGFITAIAAVAQQPQKNKVPVVFPVFVPIEQGATYYMHYAILNTGYYGYNLYVDSSPDCNGAHYCNILTMNVATMGSLETYKSSDGQVMTVAAILNNGIQANYTQGFSMADYWNPSIAWQQNGITYTLTWRGIADTEMTESAMLTMANNLQAYPFQLANS